MGLPAGTVWQVGVRGEAVVEEIFVVVIMEVTMEISVVEPSEIPASEPFATTTVEVARASALESAAAVHCRHPGRDARA
ncbi:hypothetical protein J2Y48_003079 [Mycoplana sp. BE70]|uniref:hypothetical protein n=1 Tax=Mycoplana sp. BE70 TaxID=2817775 RepID=UPI00286300D2|nr:hypothetical protein [Mycoplana sp. BE70]MDR6757782.1 hypothetical protein [Mycoplana sp. BE70]